MEGVVNMSHISPQILVICSSFRIFGHRHFSFFENFIPEKGGQILTAKRKNADASLGRIVSQRQEGWAPWAGRHSNAFFGCLQGLDFQEIRSSMSEGGQRNVFLRWPIWKFSAKLRIWRFHKSTRVVSGIFNMQIFVLPERVLKMFVSKMGKRPCPAFSEANGRQNLLTMLF